jgi:hypothetical protein
MTFPLPLSFHGVWITEVCQSQFLARIEVLHSNLALLNSGRGEHCTRRSIPSGCCWPSDQWQFVLVVVVLESAFASSVRVVVDWHFVPAGGTIGAGAAVFIGGVKLGASDGSNVAIAAAGVPESCPALG